MTEIDKIINNTKKYGSLIIDSIPEEAYIHIDNSRQKRNSPIKINKIPIGIHYLKLTHEGYEDIEEEFEISNDELTTVNITMKRNSDMLEKIKNEELSNDSNDVMVKKLETDISDLKKKIIIGVIIIIIILYYIYKKDR